MGEIQVEQLVTYSKPPINEVAIAIQFDELKLEFLDFVRVREAFADRFPLVEEKEPLPPRFELFPQPITLLKTMLVEGLLERRFWFVASDQQNLVQVQSDRFVRNWRKRADDQTYPRASTIMNGFAADLAVFRSALNDRRLKVNQVEVSYFNNVPLLNGESFVDATRRCFNFWDSFPQSTAVMPTFPVPEMAHINLRFVFQSESGEPLGRLYFDVIPSKSNEGVDQLRVQLVARGAPADETDSSVLDFVQLARKQIVGTFDALLRDEMKRAWGRS